jgi:hypothetical protein
MSPFDPSMEIHIADNIDLYFDSDVRSTASPSVSSILVGDWILCLVSLRHYCFPAAKKRVGYFFMSLLMF